MKTQIPQDFSRSAALRPTDNDLDAEWTPERKAAVLGQVTAAITSESAADRDTAGHTVPGHADPVPATPGHSTPERRAFTLGVAAAISALPHRISRRRAVLITSGLAAAVVALLAIPLLVPSGSPAGPPSATALEALAAAASAQQPLGPDQYVHMVYEQQANGYVTGMEIWTAADGKVWHKDTAAGTAMYYTVVPASSAVDYPSQAFLMSLPTDPDALGDYLRSHAHGTNSQDEAVFVSIGDMLRNGLPRSALRAAMLRVLEVTPHVTAASGTDDLRRPATVVTFDDQSIRRGVTQSLYFDPKTADFLGNRMTGPDLETTETVTSAGIVDSIPAEVHRYADHYTDIGTCVTDRGVQTPDVCMHARLGSRYNVPDDSPLPYITTAAAPPTK